MSQEDIWQNGETELKETSFSRPQIILKGISHSLSEMNVRNYFNTHTEEQINLNSIYQYFKDEMFQDYQGLYITHLLATAKCIDYKKIFKALDAVFEEISPNVGSLTDRNFNYFQYYLLCCGLPQLQDLESYTFGMYEIGIKHGMNTSYTDSYNYSIPLYYLANANIRHIRQNYKKFLLAENIILKPVDLYQDFVPWDLLNLRIRNSYTDAGIHAQELVSKYPLFSLIMKYSNRCKIYLYTSEEKKLLENFKYEINSYCNSFILKKSK